MINIHLYSTLKTIHLGLCFNFHLLSYIDLMDYCKVNILLLSYLDLVSWHLIG